jgi:hypothetical protein
VWIDLHTVFIASASGLHQVVRVLVAEWKAAKSTDSMAAAFPGGCLYGGIMAVDPRPRLDLVREDDLAPWGVTRQYDFGQFVLLYNEQQYNRKTARQPIVIAADGGLALPSEAVNHADGRVQPSVLRDVVGAVPLHLLFATPKAVQLVQQTRAAPVQGLRVAIFLPWWQQWKLQGFTRGNKISSLWLGANGDATIAIYSRERRSKALEQSTETDVEQDVDHTSTTKDTEEVSMR